MLWAICFIFASQSVVYSNEKVRLSTGEWSPFISEKLEHNGLLAQITTEAFATQGIDAELGFFPWGRVAQLSREGVWDGTIAYARTVEREKYYIYSEPIYVGKYVFFHLKSYPFKWKKYEDLKDIKIAATQGFGGMGKEFLAAEEKKIINVDRVFSDIQSFKMLLLHRVQAVASDLEVGYVLVHQNFEKGETDLITHSDTYIQNAKYHLVMPKKLKKSEELIKKFNLGLQALKKSGRYKEIIKEHYQTKIYKDAVPPNYLMSL